VRSSSPTAVRAVPVSAQNVGDLLTALRQVPDPRPGGARVHPTAYVLGVLVGSFACAGFESYLAAAQWAAGADRELLLALGATPDPLSGAVVAPSEATIRRITCRVDREALDAVVAAWTASQLEPAVPGAARVAVAIDGKTVRGARVAGQATPHLLSAATHDRALVLAQRQIPGKTNEIPMVAALLDDLRAAGHDLAQMVFTLDALHTQHATADLLDSAGAGYVMTVKGNQPKLRDAVIDQLRDQDPARTRQHSRGHGRTEERLLSVVPATGIDFPGAQQVFRIVRYTGGLDGQRVRKEVVYGITNLTADQADPDQLAALVRGHWSIENSVHWVRDVTYREDASRARTGNAPAVLAAIRNAVTTALRLAGAVSIAAARRTAALDPPTIIKLFKRRPNQDKPPM
jgi:hypothetical protein